MSKAVSATILLIEDDEVIRGLYSKIFGFNGYRVIEAADGEDGVEKFKEHRDEIRLLISDVMMPNKNGRETYEEITNIRSGVKVIFTSGFNSELTRTLRDEGFHYLQKPFSPQDLLDKIAEVLADGRQ